MTHKSVYQVMELPRLHNFWLPLTEQDQHPLPPRLGVRIHTQKIKSNRTRNKNNGTNLPSANFYKRDHDTLSPESGDKTRNDQGVALSALQFSCEPDSGQQSLEQAPFKGLDYTTRFYTRFHIYTTEVLPSLFLQIHVLTRLCLIIETLISLAERVAASMGLHFLNSQQQTYHICMKSAQSLYNPLTFLLPPESWHRILRGIFYPPGVDLHSRPHEDGLRTTWLSNEFRHFDAYCGVVHVMSLSTQNWYRSTSLMFFVESLVSVIPSPKALSKSAASSLRRWVSK